MLNYKLDIDFKELEIALKEHKKKMNSIARRMMGKVLADIKKETRDTKLKGQVLNKRSGKLIKMLKFKTFKDFTGYLSSKAFYSSWLENGNSNIPARPYLKPTLDTFFESSKAETIMDRILQDALDKIYNTGK